MGIITIKTLRVPINGESIFEERIGQQIPFGVKLGPSCTNSMIYDCIQGV